MSSIPNFLKKDGRSLLFKDEGELIFYIPEYYFERGYVVVDGRSIKLLGLFNYKLFNKDGKDIGGLRFFNFPSVFTCIPSEMEDVKRLKLDKTLPVDDYKMLKFRKDDVVIESTKVPRSSDNMELFLKMVNSGKIPSAIPYNKLHDVFIENAKLNGESYGVSMQIIGVVVSEICRSTGSISKPYRLSTSNDYNAYTTINVADISNYTSAFAAVTGENWNRALGSAITSTDGKLSPLEKVMHK